MRHSDGNIGCVDGHALGQRHGGHHGQREDRGRRIERFAEQRHREQHRQKRLQQLHLAHAHGATERQRAVPGEEAEPHREHRDVGEAAPGARAHGLRRPRGDGHRHGERQRHHQHPRDHLLRRDLAGQPRAADIADGGAEHREQQQAIGELQATAAAPRREADDERAAEQRAGPEAGARPLAQRPGTDRRGGQRQHAGDHRRMDGVDAQHRPAEKQRPAEHHAGGGEREPRPLRRARPRRTHRSQVRRRQQAGHRGTADGDEHRGQLRIGGRAAGQPRHRDAQREDEDTEHAEGESTRG